MWTLTCLKLIREQWFAGTLGARPSLARCSPIFMLAAAICVRVTMDNESSPTFSVSPESFDRFRSALADRYQIEREAGRGGDGTVYLAVDLKHGRHRAIRCCIRTMLTL